MFLPNLISLFLAQSENTCDLFHSHFDVSNEQTKLNCDFYFFIPNTCSHKIPEYINLN